MQQVTIVVVAHFDVVNAPACCQQVGGITHLRQIAGLRVAACGLFAAFPHWICPFGVMGGGHLPSQRHCTTPGTSVPEHRPRCNANEHDTRDAMHEQANTREQSRCHI
jgi:hypothetical protein